MSVRGNIIPLILVANYSITDVGQFALANRLLLVPAALIGGALSDAFRAEFVMRLRERREINRLMSKTLVTLLLLATPLFGIVAVGAPMLFSLVFGAEYGGSGYMARAIALALAAQFIGNPFSTIFATLRRSAMGLGIQFAIIVGPLTALTIAAVAGVPLIITMYIYSTVSAISIATMVYLVFRLCKSVANLPVAQNFK